MAKGNRRRLPDETIRLRLNDIRDRYCTCCFYKEFERLLAEFTARARERRAGKVRRVFSAKEAKKLEEALKFKGTMEDYPPYRAREKKARKGKG